MKSFNEWYNYNKQIDGPALNPHTISGAEVQIRNLAGNIRTTFLIDESFAQDTAAIKKCSDLLEAAANALSEVKQRNQIHKFNKAGG